MGGPININSKVFFVDYNTCHNTTEIFDRIGITETIYKIVLVKPYLKIKFRFRPSMSPQKKYRNII